ncbi:MAG: cyclic nucleotide-binding/CBS domain-containing protein [Nitrospiria bacterium]
MNVKPHCARNIVQAGSVALHVAKQCNRRRVFNHAWEEDMTPLALLMHREIEQTSPKATLREAAQKMRDKAVGSLVVSEGDETIGIISEADLVRKGTAERLDPDTTSIESIMSTPIISIDIDKTAKEANNLMANKGIRHLAVSDRGKIVGIISVRDLVICFKNRL